MGSRTLPMVVPMMVVSVLSPAVLLGQAVAPSKPAAPKAALKSYTPPKTPWGDPDLQGQWPANANIPMQRPASFGERATLTDEEVAARQKQAQRQSESDREEKAGENTTVTVNPPSYWQEHGAVSRQASLVVDPPNGRIPSPVSAAQGYDSMYLLAAAIKQAGNTNGVKVREALESLKEKIDGVVTTYDHPYTHDNHEAITKEMVVMGEVKDGHVVRAGAK